MLVCEDAANAVVTVLRVKHCFSDASNGYTSLSFTVISRDTRRDLITTLSLPEAFPLTNETTSVILTLLVCC